MARSGTIAWLSRVTPIPPRVVYSSAAAMGWDVWVMVTIQLGLERRETKKYGLRYGSPLDARL
jgi:hypothetical protein